MTKRFPLAAALALSLGATATAAQAGQAEAQACVGADEAEGLVLALAPDLLRAVGTSCASALPPAALVRQTSGPYLARYQAAADEAWPRGKAALARIAGPQVAGIMDSELARPLVATLMVPLLTKDLKPKDCPAIDRMLTLLAPLPPRNVAAIVVTVAQLAGEDRAAKGRKQPVTICPATPPRN